MIAGLDVTVTVGPDMSVEVNPATVPVREDPHREWIILRVEGFGDASVSLAGEPADLMAFANQLANIAYGVDETRARNARDALLAVTEAETVST